MTDEGQGKGWIKAATARFLQLSRGIEQELENRVQNWESSHLSALPHFGQLQLKQLPGGMP